MKIRFYRNPLLLAAAGAFTLTFAGQAQSVATTASPEVAGYLERSRQMMAEGNYAGSVDQLRRLSSLDSSLLSPEQRELCSWLLALSYYQRGEANCVEALRDFISTYPASIYAVNAQLTLGDYYFFAGEYGPATEEYSQIELSSLSGSEKSKYTYRRALSLLKVGETSYPTTLFQSLLGVQEYSAAALFYLAYIDYTQGNLDRAYSDFTHVASSLPAGRSSYKGKEYVPTGLEAGYYLAQIEFKRGEYDKVIKRGKELVEQQPVQEFLPEICRLIGESYFRLDNHTQAGNWLQKYVDMAGEGAYHTAVYDLGIVRYDEGDLSEAINLFSRLTDDRDAISQSAYLYLGQCAVRRGDDNSAAVSFRKAAQMDFDSNVTETALYNYVTATTHGGDIPFASSIEMLEDFLFRFPRSEYAPAMEEYLAVAYYNEKNYAKALESINRISRPSDKVLASKQKVLYELGVEAVANGKGADGEKYFSEAVRLSSYDPSLALQSRLWLADSYYLQSKYSQAEKEYEKFISQTKNSANRTLARYDLAYALYMQGKYKQAATKFADAISSKPSLSNTLLADAWIRQGDCRYYTGSYKSALEAYDKAIALGASESDYATYRRAVMYGLSGNLDKKISELSLMRSKYPSSRWLPAAMLEKARTYQGMENDSEAVASFEELMDAYPKSAEARKGMLEMGLALKKSGQAQRGASTLRELISRWPSSEEAQLANNELRQYYASTGELRDYANFLASVPGAPQMEENEMERLEYENAEIAYGNSNDITALERYAADYPNGTYLAQVLLDLSEAYTETGQLHKALASLDSLLKKKGDSPQAVEALYRKAHILEEMDADTEEILQVYQKLLQEGGADYVNEAYAGIMRNSSNASEKIKYARLVQQNGTDSPELVAEARFNEAEGMKMLGQTGEAAEILSSLAENPKSLYGAMAAVTLGQLYLDEGKTNKAEEVLTTFTDEGTPHQYWLARGYIALADVYKAKGNNYLAIEYLKSLRDNYPGGESDIRNMIQSRLKALGK